MTLPLGAIVISPDMGDWQAQRQVFRAARFSVGKVHIPAGFDTGPAHVRDLIADGARTVILRTEDAGLTPESVRSDLYDRGFVDLIHAYPEIEFWLQVGNEPERYHTVPTPEEYRHQLLAVYDGLSRDEDLAPLRWMAGVPITTAYYDVFAKRDAVIDRYDALAVNLYGHHYISDTGSEKQQNYLRALRIGHPVWIAETGINDPGISKQEKGRRIVDFWKSLSESRMTRRQMLGVVLFALGTGTRWPQYEINSAMAAELGAREGERERYFPETGYTIRDPFLEAWERYGGIPVLGYPISGEIVEDGRTVQYTERWRLEHHPEHAGSQWEVLGGHLGREVYEQRYGGA